jgi:hypothetical protein
MPSLETVESFVSLVESGKTVEAMVRFYAEHATMQENATPPRTGKTALIQHEEAALASISSLVATCVRPIFISGDWVVIRWVFEIQDKSGKSIHGLKSSPINAGTAISWPKSGSFMTQPSSSSPTLRRWRHLDCALALQFPAVLPALGLPRLAFMQRESALSATEHK